MEKQKIKIVDAIVDHDYNCVSAVIDGDTVQFVLSKDIDVAQLIGKTVQIYTAPDGAFQIESIKGTKE